MTNKNLIERLRSRSGEAITRTEKLMDEAAALIEQQEEVIASLSKALHNIEDISPNEIEGVLARHALKEAGL